MEKGKTKHPAIEFIGVMAAQITRLIFAFIWSVFQLVVLMAAAYAAETVIIEKIHMPLDSGAVWLGACILLAGISMRGEKKNGE